MTCTYGSRSHTSNAPDYMQRLNNRLQRHRPKALGFSFVRGDKNQKS